MLTRIFHPTDFSAASDVAFVHALKLALARQGDLTVFHFARDADAADHGGEFPRVRETLAQWGLMPARSPGDVGALGLRVRKVDVSGHDPLDTMLEYLHDHPVDLLVLATHQRGGVARWLYQELASPLARRVSLMALFVPPAADGFVDFNTGHLHLQRIVLPVDQQPHPRPAIEMLPLIVRSVYAGAVTVELLHVGTAATMPRVRLPEVDGWTWTTRVVEGDVVDEILRGAAGPDLLVLTTEGRRGFLDALRGSTAERVIRGARCPVLTVPTVVPVDSRGWTLEPSIPDPAGA